MASHLTALEHMAGEGVVTDGAVVTVHFFATVRILGTGEVPTAHTALVALTDALGGHFDLVAGSKHFHGQFLTGFHFRGVFQADFTQFAVQAGAGLGEVALHGLADVLFLVFGQRDLQSVVTVGFNGLHLGDGAGPGLNHRDGHSGAVTGKNAGHTKFTTQNSHFLSHDCLSLELDFNVHASGQGKLAEGVNGLLRGFKDVHKPLVDAHFELLTGLLVHMHGTLNGVLMNIGGQRDGPGHTGTGIARRIHDFRNSLVQDAVIVGFELDPNAITANCRHCCLLRLKNPGRLGSAQVS